jgi:hypothetical protein
MSFEDNPADDRYELDQCLDEIKRLKSDNTTLRAACEAAKKQLEKLVRYQLSTYHDEQALAQLRAALAKEPG